MSSGKRLNIFQNHWTDLKHLKYLLLFYCLGTAFTMNAQNPFVKHFTTQDGLPSNNVWKIFQDSEKFLWFATSGGLMRYDGSIFTMYQKKDGLSLYFVSDILGEDSFGRIWLYDGSSNKLNFIFKNRIFNETKVPFLDSLEGNYRFFQDSDHRLYFYSGNRNTIVELDTNNRIIKHKLRSKTYTRNNIYLKKTGLQYDQD
jgi:Two component regulator propeller